MSKSGSPGEIPLSLGEGSQRPGEGNSVSDEIAVEIADHLATAADQLQKSGISAADARQKAEEAFGDREAISRRCYWIKAGDTVMFRAAVIGLLAVVCIALGVTMVGSWRAQTRMAEQMSALAEELKALAQQQAAAGAPTTPLEIKGKAYLGSPDKPAANTEMLICRVDDGEVVRRVATRGDGTFQSAPLPAGDYSVIAKRSIGVQSAPIYLYSGAAVPPLQLDVKHPQGQVAVSLSQPLPRLEVEGKYVIDSRLYLHLDPQELRYRRWTTKSAMPDHWPLYVWSPETGFDKEASGIPDLSSYAVLGNDELMAQTVVNFPHDGERLTAGPNKLVAAVVTDIKPFDQSDEVKRPLSGGPSDERPAIRWLGTDWVVGGYMGILWQLKLAHEPSQRPNRPYPASWVRFPKTTTAIDLNDGKVTRLEIEIPADTVSRIQTLVETYTNDFDFADAVKKERPFIREVNVRVVGSEAK